jgi:hypothetical protein
MHHGTFKQLVLAKDGVPAAQSNGLVCFEVQNASVQLRDLPRLILLQVPSDRDHSSLSGLT